MRQNDLGNDHQGDYHRRRTDAVGTGALWHVGDPFKRFGLSGYLSEEGSIAG
jgi:hypothetical protein